MKAARFNLCSIDDNKYFKEFLSAAPRRYALVRHLSFKYFSRCPRDVAVNQDVELAIDCTGLHTVKLNLHRDEITAGALDHSFPDVIESLWDRFKLHRLLDCRKLKKVILGGQGPNTSEAQEARLNLGKYIKAKFATKVTAHEIKVEHEVVAFRYYDPYNAHY